MTKIEINELKKIIKHSERYKDFILLDNPISFKDFFKDKDFDVVQIHSGEMFDVPGEKEKTIVGFCGMFSWQNNILKPLDGDIYSPSMDIIGYKEFSNEEEKINTGLDILVGDEW